MYFFVEINVSTCNPWGLITANIPFPLHLLSIENVKLAYIKSVISDDPYY